MRTKILLDANTLVSQHFLKGHLGIALIFAARRMGATIVLPESTLKEAKFHALRLAAERRREIAAAANQLQVLVGGRPAVEWPGDQVIEEAIDNHLVAIADTVEHLPLDLPIARAALARVIMRRPPSHNREEFRDALLWESALRLATENSVHFVTEDGDFLVAEAGRRRLRPDLLAEVEGEDCKLVHHLTLSSLLDTLGPEMRQLDRPTISKAVGEVLLPIVEQALTSRGVTVQEIQTPEWKAFATEDPNRLAVSFRAPFAASSTSTDSSSSESATVTADGSASLDPRTYMLTNVEMDRIDVSYQDGGRGGIQYLRTGERSSAITWKPYEFRQEL
jgi:PIN domain